MPFSSRFALLVLPFLLLFSGLPDEVVGQAALQGIVSDATSGNILDGANVTLSEVDGDRFYGAATNRNGLYQIGGIAPGRYELRVTYVGYEAITENVQFEPEERANRSFDLEPDEGMLDEVVVAPRGGASRREVGVQRITQVDLSRIPTPAAGGDLASYLTSMPGVVSTGDRGGQLYIRGGLPSQNMILMDGAMIYQPFHIVGFFSAFPEDLVSSTEFHAGGFGPKYVGRTSSVMDIRMADGDRYETGGTASVSPFVADVTVEGPIKEGTSSWIGSFRHSLIEQTSSWLMSRQQPLHFDSQFLKVSQLSESDSRCSALGMRTYDRGQLDSGSSDEINWSNVVVSGRCLFLPENSNLFLAMDSGISTFNNQLVSEDVANLEAGVTRFHLNTNMTQQAGAVELEYGMNSFMEWMSYDMNEKFIGIQDQSEDMFSIGFHASAAIPLGERVTVTPGAALSVYPNRYPASVEPRIRASWQPFGRESEQLSAAAGIYRQALVGVNDMRDASSVFTAWMLSPLSDEQVETRHALLGWRQELPWGLQLSVEGYGKWIQDQPVSVWSPIARFSSELALADGVVYGGDLTLELNTRRFYGFVGYGLSWMEYESAQASFGSWFGEPVQTYHPPHDRRHQLQAMGSLELGEYTLSSRWQLGSGLPFTRPIGFDEIHYFDGPLPDIRREYGTPRVIMDRPYGGRMPTYHRMDVSLERTFDFPQGEVALQVGAINAYDQTNIFFYDIYTHRRVDQMPVALYGSLKVTI
ncbi:MAG: carboxypeptidase regulatory-like domain-containing protein [Balneolaceae bacterium]